MGQIRIKQAIADNIGSIIFSGANNRLSENTSNLFWDNTNLRLGIRTGDPFNDQISYAGDVNFASYVVLRTPDSSYGFNHNTGTIEIASYIDSTFTGVEAMIGTTSAHGFGIFASDLVRIIVKSTGQVGINTGVTALTGAFTVFGTGTTTATLGLSVHNSTGTSNSLIIRDDASIGMGVAPASIAAKLHILGLGATTATSALTVHNSTGTSNSLIVRNDGSVGMGVALASIAARLQINGLGATSATFALRVHNSTGTSNSLVVRNDGLIGVNVAAPTARLDLLNNLAATANGILATSSGATAVAIAASGNFTNTRTGATTGNVGIIGSALGNTSRNIGVAGLGGNATLTAPATTAIGVLGQIPTATTTVTSYGGYFSNLSTSATTKGAVYAELSGTVASGTSYGYRLVHSGINTAGEAYGGHFVITGANTNNYGLYLEASGATNNYGLITNGSIFNGLGILTPTATLHIVSSGSTSSTFGLRIHNSTGTNNALIVRDDGYVGVGTVPDYRFHVKEDANNYMYYNGVAGEPLTVYSSTTTIAGFRANRNGTTLTMVSGSSGNSYINVNGSPGRLDFYANNESVYAGGYNQTGDWGFGTTPNAGAKVYIISANGQGFGTVIGTNNLSPAEFAFQVRDAANGVRLAVSATGRTTVDNVLWVGNSIGSISTVATFISKGIDSLASSYNSQWQNLSGTNLMTINNAGQIGINTLDWTGGVGGTTDKFVVRGSNGDTGYHTLGFFENSINPTANNVYYQRGLTTNAIKYGTFNTFQITGAFNVARNEGTGSVSELFGTFSYAFNSGAAAISNMTGFYSDKQIQAGTITTASSLVAATTQISGGTVTNLYGLYVTTPANTGGTVTNTAGVYIENNSIGTNNYGIIANGNMSNGFGTSTPSVNAILHLFSTTKAALKIEPISATQASSITAEDGMEIYVNTTNGTFTSIGFWGYENGTWIKL